MTNEDPGWDRVDAVARVIDRMREAARAGRLMRGEDPELEGEVQAAGRIILGERYNADAAWAAIAELAFQR